MKHIQMNQVEQRVIFYSLHTIQVKLLPNSQYSNPDKKVGTGALICLAKECLPLTENV